MQKIGWALMVLGGGLLAGYWAYVIVTRVLSEAPMLIRLGVVAAIFGLALLLLSVIRERLKEQKEEKGQF